MSRDTFEAMRTRFSERYLMTIAAGWRLLMQAIALGALMADNTNSMGHGAGL